MFKVVDKHSGWLAATSAGACVARRRCPHPPEHHRKDHRLSTRAFFRLWGARTTRRAVSGCANDATRCFGGANDATRCFGKRKRLSDIRPALRSFYTANGFRKKIRRNKSTGTCPGRKLMDHVQVILENLQTATWTINFCASWSEFGRV